MVKIKNNTIEQYELTSTNYTIERITRHSCCCCYCNEFGDLKHLFIKCQSLDDLWKGIEHKLSRYSSKPIRILSNIVLGYKHNELEYFDLDLLFSIVGFTFLN